MLSWLCVQSTIFEYYTAEYQFSSWRCTCIHLPISDRTNWASPTLSLNIDRFPAAILWTSTDVHVACDVRSGIVSTDPAWNWVFRNRKWVFNYETYSEYVSSLRWKIITLEHTQDMNQKEEHYSLVLLSLQCALRIVICSSLGVIFL